MGYQSQHIYYVFSGTLPGGEVWNTGYRTGTAVVTLDQLTSLVGLIGASFGAHLFGANTGIKEFNPASVTYVGCTGYLVPATGPSLLVAQYSEATPLTGSASAQTAPNQTALVASLRSARAGRSNRGRMYLPFLAPTFVEGTGRIVAGYAVQAATGMAAFLSTANGEQGGTTPAGPFPASIQSQTEAGTPALVTAVLVGNVADTQRRRRDKLIETYTSEPVTYTPGG